MTHTIPEVDADIDLALDNPAPERRPWTVRVYVILGGVVATSVTAIVAEHHDQTAVRSGAVVVAVLLGIALIPAVSRAEVEG